MKVGFCVAVLFVFALCVDSARAQERPKVVIEVSDQATQKKFAIVFNPDDLLRQDQIRCNTPAFESHYLTEHRKVEYGFSLHKVIGREYRGVFVHGIQRIIDKDGLRSTTSSIMFTFQPVLFTELSFGLEYNQWLFMTAGEDPFKYSLLVFTSSGAYLEKLQGNLKHESMQCDFNVH